MQFLCIVPKYGRSGPPDNEKLSGEVQRIVASVDQAYRPYLGAGYRMPRLIRASSNASAFVTVWDRISDLAEGSFYSSGDRWVAAAGQHVAQEIHRDVILAGGSLRYAHPVWGSYAVIVGERYMDRLTAWCTTPALEAIHYGQNDDYIFISNRPIIAALARAYGLPQNVSLSDDYVSEYLAYGYSVSGKTPFSEIYTSPVDAAVSVVKGCLKLEPVPRGLESKLAPDHSEAEGAAALAAALTNAMDRTERQIGDSNLQVRLSGGKDSRLMLGLLRGRDIEASAITYGTSADTEVAIATHIAHMAKIPHSVGSPRISAGSNSSEQTLTTIAECGGIPPSEPHLARNVGSNSETANEAIMLGQWPLFKGGMAKVVRYPKGGVTKTLCKQISPLVSEDVRRTYENHLLSWADRVHASSELEKLYLFAREFRSGRYLHSHITHYARDAKIAYPISDAEVTAVSDDLTMFEKVSQKALFLAMREIWPESLSVPLHNSVWRFEAGGPTEISGPDYHDRHGTVDVAGNTGDSNIDGSSPNALDSETINALCRELVSSDQWDSLVSFIAPVMRESIVLSATETVGWSYKASGAEYTTKEFSKYVWRVYVAAKWRSREWMIED